MTSAHPIERKEFSNLVTRLRREHPIWFDLASDSKASVESITTIERELEVTLPADYIWFLRIHGGGDFAFISVFSADPDSDLYLLNNQVQHRPFDFVAFCDNGTGDVLGFGVEGGKCVDAVLTLDHDSGQIDMPGRGPFLGFIAENGLKPR